MNQAKYWQLPLLFGKETGFALLNEKAVKQKGTRKIKAYFSSFTNWFLNNPLDYQIAIMLQRSNLPGFEVLEKVQTLALPFKETITGDVERKEIKSFKSFQEWLRRQLILFPKTESRKTPKNDQ